MVRQRGTHDADVSSMASVAAEARAPKRRVLKKTGAPHQRRPTSKALEQPSTGNDVAEPMPEGTHSEETEEIKQLRSELAEAASCLANEKRARQRLKDRCEKSQKELIGAQKDLDKLSAKLDHANSVLAGCQGQDRGELTAHVLQLDVDTEIATGQLREAEAELSKLNASTAQKHRGKLQRDVEKIRSSDETKKLTCWRKKVAAAEKNVAAVKQELTALKQARGSTSLLVAPREASGAKKPSAPLSNQDADLALEKLKQSFAAQLAKLQDDITRESRQTQDTNSKSLDEVVKRNHTMSIELAHLEHHKAGRDIELSNLHRDVDGLSKTVEGARKKRESIEMERQNIVKERGVIVDNTQALVLKIQEESHALNQLMMMSSDAPLMHEKAWAQEKAALNATLNATHAKNKKLEQDLQNATSRVESLTQDIVLEGELCSEEAELLKQLDRLRNSLQAAVAQQNALMMDADDGSQKDNIIRDLEGAIKTEKRHIQEMQALNERLDKKYAAALALLHKHGFDV